MAEPRLLKLLAAASILKASNLPFLHGREPPGGSVRIRQPVLWFVSERLVVPVDLARFLRVSFQVWFGIAVRLRSLVFVERD